MIIVIIVIAVVMRVITPLLYPSSALKAPKPCLLGRKKVFCRDFTLRGHTNK